MSPPVTSHDSWCLPGVTVWANPAAGYCSSYCRYRWCFNSDYAKLGTSSRLWCSGTQPGCCWDTGLNRTGSGSCNRTDRPTSPSTLPGCHHSLYPNCFWSQQYCQQSISYTVSRQQCCSRQCSSTGWRSRASYCSSLGTNKWQCNGEHTTFSTGVSATAARH